MGLCLPPPAPLLNTGYAALFPKARGETDGQRILPLPHLFPPVSLGLILMGRGSRCCHNPALYLALILTHPPTNRSKQEFPATSTAPGKRALLLAAQQRLRQWKSLLHRYLPGEDEQVDLLLTLEEFCAQEGYFEESGEHGRFFADVFVE